MKSRGNNFRLVVSLGALLGVALAPGWWAARAQQPSTTQAQANAPGKTTSPGQTTSQDQGSQSSPLYRVTVVARTTKAINYSHAKGSTPIDFKGTVLMPFAKGEAKVEGKKGVISVSAKFDKLSPASTVRPAISDLRVVGGDAGGARVESGRTGARRREGES